MTINSLSSIASTVVGGLGTQTFNIVNACNYVLEFKSFLPYLASGSQPQSTSPSPNVTDITLAADSSGSRNSTYLLFSDASNLHQYYLWFNINSAGVDPAVANRTGIEVVGATDATANTLATAARAAINASSAASYMTVSGATSHVILSQKSPGTVTAFANGTASAGASFSVTSAGSYGVPAMSGVTVKVYLESEEILAVGNPSPTEPMIGGSVSFLASAGDVVEVVLASLSTADAYPNAVKSIINLYPGV
jgi:hypothetical protein